MPEGRRIDILDCTIRDGSYLINYQFTAEDTYVTALALCEAGVKRIEVGHGIGLDAQIRGKGSAAEEDVRYIEAAVAAVEKRAKIGVFFIPGIGYLDSIRRAADAGLDFIRVGTNINEFKSSEEAIKIGKECGLEVWSNLMKSYVASPEEFGAVCSRVEEFGADVAVLVDSAGGMTPDQICAYTQEGLASVSIPLGFHGHNNLQLAHANCLAFVNAGGQMLDGSLRGMGRSAGNAATEVLCALLIREGYDICTIDWRQLMRLAQNLIAPGMPRDCGLLPVQIASGLSLFHSSFQPLIDRSSADVGVESFETILELGDKEAQKEITAERAKKASRQARNRRMQLTQHAAPDDRWVHHGSCATIDDLNHSLQVLSAKTGYPPVMTLARPRLETSSGALHITPLRVGMRYCIGHVESPTPEMDREIVDRFSTNVELWMGDQVIEKPGNLPFDAKWLAYDDDQLLVTALSDFLRVRYPGASVYIPVSEDRVTQLALHQLEFRQETPCDVGVAIGGVRKFGEEDAATICQGGALLLAQPKSATVAAIHAARERDARIWRLDFGQALGAEVLRLFDTQLYLGEHAGSCQVGNITIVSSGVVGEVGAVVVNSIRRPTMILGEADGCGGIQPISSENSTIRRTVIEWMGRQSSTEVS